MKKNLNRNGRFRTADPCHVKAMLSH